jgi:hypothetical protein
MPMNVLTDSGVCTPGVTTPLGFAGFRGHSWADASAALRSGRSDSERVRTESDTAWRSQCHANVRYRTFARLLPRWQALSVVEGLDRTDHARFLPNPYHTARDMLPPMNPWGSLSSYSPSGAFALSASAGAWHHRFRSWKGDSVRQKMRYMPEYLHTHSRTDDRDEYALAIRGPLGLLRVAPAIMTEAKAGSTPAVPPGGAGTSAGQSFKIMKSKSE